MSSPEFCSPQPPSSPEIAESVFLAWRLTRDPRYRTYAWSIFSAIETHCRLPGAGAPSPDIQSVYKAAVYKVLVNVNDRPLRFCNTSMLYI
ncbi:hypothetical protein K438DRAFT_1973944 [Mycena galopus ATCC 62051]|nr:hypothetical protein K438DRAFT_1987294 [Mycena galopus ATCC 62051]KAF8185228.1 hypothetical protein K438DRAFT_1973944 [Mycena galopus ATCC 62051]